MHKLPSRARDKSEEMQGEVKAYWDLPFRETSRLTFFISRRILLGILELKVKNKFCDGNVPLRDISAACQIWLIFILLMTIGKIIHSMNGFPCTLKRWAAKWRDVRNGKTFWVPFFTVSSPTRRIRFHWAHEKLPAKRANIDWTHT